MSREPSLEQRGCPVEILLQIFEDVHRIAPASSYDLRLVSRQFNSLVHPIVYRHVKLNDTLVNCFEVDDDLEMSSEVVDLRRRVRNAISTFTRQISIREALDWASVVSLLSSLKTLNHLHWSFWNKMGPLSSQQIPQCVLDGLAERWPNVQVSVENSRFCYICDASSLPSARLVSFKMQGTLGHPSRQAGPTLKRILLGAHQLKVLHLLDIPSGKRFIDENIGQGEILPAVEELFLQGYFWLHSPSVATTFWNWSKLTSLRLEKVFIVNFLVTVLPECLTQLRSFVTDGHCQSAVDHTKVRVLHAMLARLLSQECVS